MSRRATNRLSAPARRALALTLVLSVYLSGMGAGPLSPARAGTSPPSTEPVEADPADTDPANTDLIGTDDADADTAELGAALAAIDPVDPVSVDGTGRMLGAPVTDGAGEATGASAAATTRAEASPDVASAALPTVTGCSLTDDVGGGQVSTCPAATNMTDALNGLGLATERSRVAAATSRLTVTAQPKGAEVLVNAVPMGNAPVDLKLPPGVYSVRVVMDGYQPFSANVTLSPDLPVTLSATLTTDPASDGWFYWIDPQAMARLAGGYQYGDFYLRNFVKDKLGAVYVQFENFDTVDYTGRPGVTPPAPIKPVDPPRFTESVVGVAVTRDKGATWTLVKAWPSQSTIRRWNSRRFVDSKKSEHYLHGYYQQRTSTGFKITDLVPLESGIGIEITKSVSRLPQEVLLAWDTNGNDISGGETKNPPISPFEQAPASSPILWRPTAAVKARWGLGGNDLVTFRWTATAQQLVYNSASGAESTVSINGPTPSTYRGPTYIGSRNKIAFYLGKELNAVGRESAGLRKRYIFSSSDGGSTKRLISTFSVTVPVLFDLSSDEVRMAPDGVFNVVERTLGVGVVAAGKVRWLGKVPSSLTSGYYLTSGNFDGAGNYHAAISNMMLGKNNPNMRIYYQYFPRTPVSYTRVALFTEPNCTTCTAARNWLRSAGVRFTENPTDLGTSVNTSIVATGAKVGYPVLVRIGTTSLVVGDASPAVLTRALGKSYPILVDERPARTNGDPIYDGQGNLWNAYAPWNAVTVDETGDVSLVVEQNDGVVAYRDRGGEWHRSRLMQGGYQVVGFQGRINPIIRTVLPGRGRAEVPYNAMRRPSDLAFFMLSQIASLTGYFGRPRVHDWYTLNTPQKPPTTGSARAVATVTQMVPASAFNVELGPTATVGAVEGELAQYVTGSAITTVNGQRTFEVKVDLRHRNETASGGAILGRSIGGYVQVQTTNEDGAPETRTVSLILLVQNYRLRYADATLATFAQDFSSEVVHFVGAAERWVITNNLALPNEISCGPGQSILIDPLSKATFTAAQVSSFGVKSCLQALKVAPTPISGCESWEDKKRVLAAETMGALAQSLPLSSSGSTTNWELSFGSRNATVRRIVVVDEVAPLGGGIRCGAEVDGKSVAIVTLTGPIIGATEDYDPAILVEEQGVADVSNASTALVAALASQRRALELESAMLEGQLRLSADDAGLTDWLFRGFASRQATYRRDLLAVRALLHCNSDGQDVFAVRRLLDRGPSTLLSLSGPAGCLQRFLKNPSLYWETYNPDLTSGVVEAGQLVAVMNSAFAENSMLQFFLRSARGEPLVLDAFLAERAWSGGTSSSAAVLHRAIDDWARQMTATSASLNGAEGGIISAVVMSGPVERRAIQTLASCAAQQGGANPWVDIVGKTKAMLYTSGLACVDSAALGQAKIDRYRYLRLAVYSSIFQTLVQMAASDLSVLNDLLAMTTDVITRVDAAETKYKAMTKLPIWNESLPALDRMVIGLGQARKLSAKVAPAVTVGSVKAVVGGLVECGIGIVKSLVSAAGIALLVLGGVAVAVGGFAASGGAIVFLGSGVAFTGLAAWELDSAWEQLGFQERLTGVCGVATSAVMTVVGARAAAPSLARAASGVKPKVLNVSSTVRATRSGGKTVGEQVTALSSRGGRVVVEPVPVRPLSVRLKALLDRFDGGRRAVLAEAAIRLGYDALPADLKTLVDAVIVVYGKPNGLALALQKRLAEISRLKSTNVDAAKAFADVSLGLLMEAIPGRPKSFAVSAVEGGVLGADAEILSSALGQSKVRINDLRYRKGGAEAQAVEVGLLESLFDSARMRAALQPGAAAKPLLNAQEASWLSSVSRQANPSIQPNLFNLLASPEAAAYIQRAVFNARRIAGVPNGKVLAVNAAYVTSGAFKSTIRLKLTIEGVAKPLEIAIKKGLMEDVELRFLIELSQKGLSQKPYVTRLLEGAGFGEVITMEEWVPGELLGSVRGQAGTPEAVARFDALMFARTLRGTGDSARSMFNRDLHGGNVKVFESAGQQKALAIDLDPKFNTRVSPTEYWARSAGRRLFSEKFGVGGDPVAYLDTALNTMVAEGVPRSTALGYLRDAAAGVRDLNNTPLKIDDFGSYGEAAAAVNGVPTVLDAFLTGK